MPEIMLLLALLLAKRSTTKLTFASSQLQKRADRR
jgi:hypothetical protein